eukprot:scaffold100691_cov61-Attheya_sp.AAC.2
MENLGMVPPIIAYMLVNVMVALHILTLKVCHPVLVFCGSLAILAGSIRVIYRSKTNRKKMQMKLTKRFLENRKNKGGNSSGMEHRYPDWDLAYTN